MARQISAQQLARMLGPWRGAADRLDEALAAAVRDLVDAALLPEATTLPPQRQLATTLGVSRGTVSAAYDALVAADYAVARQGSGTQLHRRHAGEVPGGGRLFSLAAGGEAQVDLSSGALPASDLVADAWAATTAHDLAPYLPADGYFPAGLPPLRTAIARQLTAEGHPTEPGQLLITSGAQQAVWLIAHTLLSHGDRIAVEDPTYRGALEAFTGAGLALTGVRTTSAGIDADQLRALRRRGHTALYCQPAVHNPTGRILGPQARRALGALVDELGLLAVEDCSSRDLVLSGGPCPARGLGGLVDPDRLVTVGSTSKLFWGGIRVGWIRAAEPLVRKLTQAKKAVDLSTSLLDQMLLLDLMRHLDRARALRNAMLRERLDAAHAQLKAVFPDWRWENPQGGTGLWVDTGLNAVELDARARTVGIKLAPGPTFSVYDGFTTYLRLPVRHDAGQLATALVVLRDLVAGRR
ncbi:2-aminoadipate transaminase [Streptomyces sp. YIM 130001]|uniref:aminotransferase-like domain-containing protein n=1 Tax=Streptomyces sp. YIM 130001 TaxID=2259644 RepID=UPI000E65256F|nr:PLP-dependent aminotransferase family protein [Streptomyces sp. YIM 130001]RII15328.1 2-aminoadipate transaminase [Streptomyces sp. YIM 130001]